MSTIEKLIVQIFERKNSIIEQVRHQVELYDQQLASKLVIQGIDPPSWLWNREAPFHSSDPSEIDKHRLISELLLPLPQHAVPYFNNFNYSSISIPECNFDQQDEPVNSACFDDVRYVPDISTEVEPVASSPQQQVATRLDDGNSGMDLSCVEFKRSKSRQRALEMRSSAKSGSKSHALDENISVVSYRNSMPGMDDFLRCSHLEKPDSAKYLNIQLDDNAKYEGMNTSCCMENKADEGYENMCVSTDHACSKTKLAGALFSEQVNKPMQSEDPLNIPPAGEAESADIKIQSCNVDNSNGSMPIQHLNHGESVDQMCDRKSIGAECSGQINKSARSPDNLGIYSEGDVESEGINIRWSMENTSEEIPNQWDEHVCGSIGHFCATKNVGAASRGQTDKPTQFQETLDIQLGDTECKSRNILCYKKDNTSEAIPCGQFNQELDFTELDVRCTSKTVGAVSGEQIDESFTERIPSAVAHGNCSSDAALDEHNLSTTGGVPLPSRISSSEISSKKLLDTVRTLYAADKDNEKGSAFSSHSLQGHPYELALSDLVTPFFIGDNNSGMMKEQTEDLSGSDKRLAKISENPVKTESSLQKNSELVPIFFAGEHDGGTSLVSSSCNPSLSHDHFLQSMQSGSPAVINASTEKGSKDHLSRENSSKSSGVNSSELHTLNCGLEGGNSLLDELKVHKTEAEVVLQLQSATVEQLYMQKENANLTACDYPLLNGVDQANKFGGQSVSCNVTSKASEDAYHMQDNIGVEENSSSKVTSSLLKATTSSFSKILGKAETESLRSSSQEAEQVTDDSMLIEKRSECFIEGSHLSLDVEAKLNEEHSEHETLSIEYALERESYAVGFEENAFVDAKYYGMMDTEQRMPVLEGFVMDTDDGGSFFAGGQIDIAESSLQSSTLRQASILERLCQSSSRSTPISQFPTTYGLHKTSDLFQSVPNGLLEHISLVGDCSNMKLQQKSHSAGLPVSTDPFSFNVGTPYASPFRKKWDHSTSSSALRSQGSLNPELVCFTIEEDPGNFDEIGNHDEAAEAPPSHGSCLKSSLKRKPLADITEDGKNPHPSVSVDNKDVLETGQTPKFCFRNQLDSAGTEANLTGAQTRARQKLGKKFSNKKRRINDAKENRNASVGANGGKQVTDLLKETKSHKPKYSENLKTTTGVSDQQKVLRSNNIVSNMSSFIPLVQQKKAAAVITGKRDVKVKALEAAEAAKRLADKKENERKMKKEAWKAEKARLEQENLLQLELKKKKKEEELMKKEAEMAARKRIREEEEKKEKEGKRRRIEEARKQQHEQEKKQADKLTRHQADGLRIHEKDTNNGLELCTKMETGGRKCRVTTESKDKSTTEPCGTKTMACDLRESNTLMKADTGDITLNMAVSDFNATAEKNPNDKAEALQSYDISPYQGSDDEDEDEDDENENDRRKEKFVPAWTSRNSLAEAVFSQQHINPDEILPPESFCSIAEVLIPRKLQVR